MKEKRKDKSEKIKRGKEKNALFGTFFFIFFISGSVSANLSALFKYKIARFQNLYPIHFRIIFKGNVKKNKKQKTKR